MSSSRATEVISMQVISMQVKISRVTEVISMQVISMQVISMQDLWGHVIL